MSSALRQQRHDNGPATSLCRELEQAHDQLLSAIDRLAEITRQPAFDPVRLTQARLQLIQASQVRRTVLADALGELLSSGARKHSAALRELQSSGTDQLMESSAHVGRWTMDAIERDWAGYCRASEATRRRMKMRIDAERLLVYPLLRSRPRTERGP